MTRKPRSKKNLERKITELYLKLQKRQTKKPARLQNLRKRIEFFKGLLQELHDQESTSSNSDLTTPSNDSLSLDSTTE
jgi:hypothetical protein